MSHKDTNLRRKITINFNQTAGSLQIHDILIYLILEYPLWSKYFVKDVLSHMRVNSTERIVQEVDVTVLIHSSCQTHSLLLSSTQVDALGEMKEQTGVLDQAIYTC